MNVKSYWVPRDEVPFGRMTVGMPVGCLNTITGQMEIVGKITQKDQERGVLILLDTAIPWQALEEHGVGWSQFEDTEE